MPAIRKLKKETFKYILIFCIVCIVLLLGMHLLAKNNIQANVEANLKQVLPGAAHFEPVVKNKQILYYNGYDNKNRVIGVAFIVSCRGYVNNIETMAAMSPAGEIITIKVIKQDETPGLGARVAEKEFSEQFNKRSLADLSKVSAISGASISSRAVIESVREKAGEVKKYYNSIN